MKDLTVATRTGDTENTIYKIRNPVIPLAVLGKMAMGFAQLNAVYGLRYREYSVSVMPDSEANEVRSTGPVSRGIWES